MTIAWYPHPSSDISLPCHLPLENIRTGNSILCNAHVLIRVDIDIDLRVTHLVNARDRSHIRGGRNGGTATGDGELSAFWIELRGVGGVDGEEFVTNEVLAWLEGGGDGAGPGAVL